MSQTSYAINMNEAYDGMLVFRTGGEVIRSLDNPNDAIKWGRGLAKDSSSDRAIKLPDGSGNSFQGVAHRDTSIEGVEYPAKTTVGAVQRGAVWVPIDQDVAPGDPVYVRYDGKVQQQTIVLSGDMASGQTFGATITIDGVETVVSVAWNTDYATTSADIEAALEAITGIASANRSNSNHTFTVIASDHGAEKILIADAEVTGAGSPPTVTVTETVAGVDDADAGIFRMDADSSTAFQVTRARWLNSGTAGGRAQLDVNLP